MPLEGIDLFDGEFALAERLNALHYVEQPTTRFRRRIPEEKRFLPFRKDQLFLANQTLLHDMNLAGLRHAAEQNVRSDPPGSARRGRQRFSFFNDFADKEVLGHYQQIDDRERL